MITAHEASELLKTTTLKASELHRSMTPFQRLEILKNKVGEKTRIALETKIHETIAKCEMRVEIILGAKICVDKNEDIRAFLVALGYDNVKVTSDFPAYCESYEGTTTIEFSIPNR